MNAYLMKAFEKEINFVSNWLAYSSLDELEPLKDLEEAQVQIDGMFEDYREDDIPETLREPEIMLVVYNYCADEERKRAQLRKIQYEDDQIAALNPDCLRFRKAYEDDSSAFFDPDQLSYDLQRTGYDEVHREIIAKALMAYQKQCQEA